MEVDEVQPPHNPCLCDSHFAQTQSKEDLSGKKKRKSVKANKKEEKLMKKELLCPAVTKRVEEAIMKNEAWLQNITAKDSPVCKLMSDRVKIFFKYNFWIKNYAREILGEDSKVFQSLNKNRLPFSKEELAAILLQNSQYPKSNFKKTAIQESKFVSISDRNSAKEYFERVVKEIISKTVKSSLQKVLRRMIQTSLLEKMNEFNSTEDIKEAARLLDGYKRGRGDLNLILESLAQPSTSNPLKKIKLIAEREYGGQILESDKNAEHSKNTQHALSQKKVFKLWQYFCKKTKQISEDEFFDYFSNYKEKQMWWNHYFDAEGKENIINDEAIREARRGKKKNWRKRKAQSNKLIK